MTESLSRPALPAAGFSSGHVFDVQSLNDHDIQYLVTLSQYYAALVHHAQPIPKCLTGKSQINLFFENSTRTNCSFELAGKKLGADVVVVPVAASSVHKGEDLQDTVQTLAAMGADAMIVRNEAPGTSRFIAHALQHASISCAVINAGEGSKGHPTQALLDAVTMVEALEIDTTKPMSTWLAGHTVAICGDIRHSRVAGSNAALLPRLGAAVRFVGPVQLMPDDRSFHDVKRFDNIEDGIGKCSIVMGLRMQFERMPDEDKIDPDTYYQQFGLTKERLAKFAPDAKVMHPGPMNRGIEIDGALADDRSKSLILNQVAHGVTTRMAILDALLTKEPAL